MSVSNEQSSTHRRFVRQPLCLGTGVVEQIDGEWKIAHYSLTLLIPNDIAEAVGKQSQRADN